MDTYKPAPCSSLQVWEHQQPSSVKVSQHETFTNSYYSVLSIDVKQRTTCSLSIENLCSSKNQVRPARLHGVTQPRKHQYSTFNAVQSSTLTQFYKFFRTGLMF